jgi:hypothetical protein
MTFRRDLGHIPAECLCIRNAIRLVCCGLGLSRTGMLSGILVFRFCAFGHNNGVNQIDAALHNMGPASPGQKRKIGNPSERCCSLKPLIASIWLGLLLAGCTHLPDIGGMPLPELGNQPPTMYPDLTDIPDAPPVTPANTADAAIGVLSQERGRAEHAADEVQKEPFISPAPPPPPTPF